MKTTKLEWYVLNHDFNSKKIISYNVLNGWEDALKEARKKKKFNNRETLKNYLKREFMYYYWCKAECEISVGGLFVKDIDKDLFKIDIWSQLEPNLDRITDYVISAMNFRFGSKKESVI